MSSHVASSPNAYRSQLLSTILDRCDTLLKSAPAPPTEVERFKLLASDVDRLHLTQYGVTAFSEAVASRQLSTSLRTGLVAVYTQAVERLLAAILSIQVPGPQIHPQMSRDIILQTVGVTIERACDQFQVMILHAIDDKTHQLHLDIADSAESVQPTTLDDEDDLLDRHGPRKHPPQALAILELAFERSPNITHAEKVRLANAIGLTPRQVTVWFQNRRNRKKAPQALTQTKTSTPRACNSRKRKLDDTDDSEYDELESSESAAIELPEKRQRCLRQTSHDSSASSSSSSLSSYDSSGSEWTPHTQRYGRIGKVRNDSGDSSITSFTTVSSGSVVIRSSSPQHLKKVETEEDSIEAEGSELSDSEQSDGEDEEDDDDEDDTEEDGDEDELDADSIEEEAGELHEPFRPVQPAAHEFLFHADGTLQPDWDDLELDLNQLEKSLSSSLELNTDISNPLQPQLLTASAMKMLNDLTPTTSTFAEQQQRLAANPTIAACNSISHAENWSILDSGLFSMPEGSPDLAAEDWSQTLLNFECSPDQLDESMRMLQDALSLDTHASASAFVQQDGQQAFSDSASTTSSHDDASSLHLDFDFDFSKLGFGASPLATPNLSSESSTFSGDAPAFTLEMCPRFDHRTLAAN